MHVKSEGRRPRVALLNNGTEATKGSEVTKKPMNFFRMKPV